MIAFDEEVEVSLTNTKGEKESVSKTNSSPSIEIFTSSSLPSFTWNNLRLSRVPLSIKSFILAFILIRPSELMVSRFSLSSEISKT